MTSTTGTARHLPREIAGWECDWQLRGSHLELQMRRKDRRSASIGQLLAGRLVIRRAHDGWHTETRFWIVEDLAEHQRLRVRRGSAPTLAELRELLSEAGLPPDLVTTVVESTAALETSAAV